MSVSRKALIASAMSVSLLGVGYLGVGAYHDVQFALAEQQVKTSERELSTLKDLSTVFRDVSQAVGPSVVNIRVTKVVKEPQASLPFDGHTFRRFFHEFGGGNEDMPFPPDSFGGGTAREIGTGSGVIMDVSGDTGYILTNNHVAGDAQNLEVTLADGRVIKDAKTVGADPKTDLAVVEIKADHLIAAKWGDSNTLRQGDWVIAFGSPFGYVGSMTHGIVSALHRHSGILGSDGYENFIQVDAPINPGNSGGPLVNVAGDVVGINTAIASASGGFQGVGFAVPSDQAKPIYETLKDKGKIVRGWLGAEIASVSQLKDEAKSAGYSGDSGVLVKGVLNGAPATGELRPGDVITTLNGKAVKDADQLRNEIAFLPPSSDVTLGVVRDSKSQDVKIKLGEQAANTNVLASRAEAGKGERTLGLRLADSTADLAQRYGLKGKSGAVVVAVDPGSPAAMAGLHRGDLLTRVGTHDVQNAKEARDLLAKSDLKKGVRMDVTNQQGEEFAFIQAK